MAQQEEV